MEARQILCVVHMPGVSVPRTYYLLRGLSGVEEQKMCTASLAVHWKVRSCIELAFSRRN